MNLSILFYLLAFVCFVAAAIVPKGWLMPVGLALFALGHCVAGVTFKAG